jgi:Flp pilus assembly protein TadG
MRTGSLLILAGALSGLVTPLFADGILGTSVTGGLYFGVFAANYYDPANTLIPDGYLNQAGPTVTVSDSAVEFGYYDGVNLITADFSDFGLTIADNVNGGDIGWTQTFQDDSFNGASVTTLTDNFTPGSTTAGISGNLLTVTWGGTSSTTPQNLSATFSFSGLAPPPPPVSESGTLALLGCGLLCFCFSGRFKPHTPAGDRRKARAGNSIVEFALVVPWYLFLFVGAVDMGLCCYALVSVQGAIRTAAVYASTNSTTATDSTTVCRYVLDQLRMLPNVPTTITTCSASPVTASTSLVSGPDGSSAASVTVTYNLPVLPGIPTVLPGPFTVTRTTEMRLQN